LLRSLVKRVLPSSDSFLSLILQPGYSSQGAASNDSRFSGCIPSMYQSRTGVYTFFEPLNFCPDSALETHSRRTVISNVGVGSVEIRLAMLTHLSL
jgi:hypothetical protein